MKKQTTSKKKIYNGCRPDHPDQDGFLLQLAVMHEIRPMITSKNQQMWILMYQIAKIISKKATT
jgi:hypothetical protein